jgi:hypothetical protein
MSDGMSEAEEAADLALRLESFLSEDSAAPLSDSRGGPLRARQLFESAQEAGRIYRTAAGFVSRKRIAKESRDRVRGWLFRARHLLDSRIEATIWDLINREELRFSRLLNRQVFGFCKKQGVSFRLSLSTCVPSRLCGGGCYAHDGRERVTSTILSGCYNTVLCEAFEQGRIAAEELVPSVRKAIHFARLDRQLSDREYGFSRRARIRLAHVGELAAFPKFANWLGETVMQISKGEVDCVIYTRHPNVSMLDTSVLVINLTIDASSENRRDWVRPGVRPVWSAWDGLLDPNAAVNFLEHHDHGQHALPQGAGNVCPVTLANTARRVCDEYACVRCFEPPCDGDHKEPPPQLFEIAVPARRVRHRGMLIEEGASGAAAAVVKGTASVRKGRTSSRGGAKG